MEVHARSEDCKDHDLENIQHVAVVGVHQNGARFSTPYSLIVDTNTIR